MNIQLIAMWLTVIISLLLSFTLSSLLCRFLSEFLSLTNVHAYSLLSNITTDPCFCLLAGLNKRESKVILTLHHKCLRHYRWCFHGIVTFCFFSKPSFVSVSSLFHGESKILLVFDFRLRGY